MKLIIRNRATFHHEIIESVIVKYREFFEEIKDEHIEIYLEFYQNDSFKKYISEKYPHVKFKKEKKYDYFIDCTIYDVHFPKIEKNKSNKKYISHEITERLQKNPNVFFLSPLAATTNLISCDILPFMEEKKKTDIPVYIIQGSLKNSRRDFNLLKEILSEPNYKHPFIFKLIGRGDLPHELLEYKHHIVVKNNLDFIDYHKEFVDGYCILPLISMDSHPQYYSTKSTSTINYAKGYNLKCLLDENLQNIYALENTQVYKDKHDIKDAFLQTLSDFYKTEK